MDSETLSNSLKTAGIFLLTSLILFLAIISGSQISYKSYDLKVALYYVVPLFLFVSYMFYFLFKYQKEEYYSKSMFWKIPLALALFGIIFMIILIVYSSFTCDGESCMGVPYLIIFIPVVAITLSLIGLFLTLNSWYKTNLYVVSWTMFVFVLIPGILTIIMWQGLEEQSIAMPFGFIFGTLLAIYLKKSSNENKKRVNKGAIIGGIIGFISASILFIYEKIRLAGSGRFITPFSMILTIFLIAIFIFLLLGALIGWIIGKIKKQK